MAVRTESVQRCNRVGRHRPPPAVAVLLADTDARSVCRLPAAVLPCPPLRLSRRRIGAAALLLALGMGLAAGTCTAAEAIELTRLDAVRSEQGVLLDFETRFELPQGVEGALQKGVALHFVAEADLMQARWYWRDRRLARTSRTWRLSYQPLTFSYRVSLGGLAQTYLTLSDALRSLQRLSRWRIADAGDGDDGEYVDFSYRLDVDQLPRPLQITIGNQPEWTLRIERTIRLLPQTR